MPAGKGKSTRIKPQSGEPSKKSVSVIDINKSSPSTLGELRKKMEQGKIVVEKHRQKTTDYLKARELTAALKEDPSKIPKHGLEFLMHSGSVDGNVKKAATLEYISRQTPSRYLKGLKNVLREKKDI